MLQVDGVHAHLGASHILRGVSVRVGEGEVVGLFGRNGMGKTTLVKTIAGWVRPSAGTIRYAGRDIAGLPSNRICRLGIGLVPEDRRIFPALTVEENLGLGLMQLSRARKAAGVGAIERIYERFPRLAERRRQMGSTLSGGEQQMLSIARVLLGAPRLLLIDEPTEGLAPRIVEEIFALLAGLRAEGAGVLLVEQSVMRALDLADRFYALERGAVVYEGRPADPVERRKLIEVIGV